VKSVIAYRENPQAAKRLKQALKQFSDFIYLGTI
jgi:hypothetical protein